MPSVTVSPTALIARQGIKEASGSLRDASKKFATGQKYSKESKNLFASVESSAGKAQTIYLESALSNLKRLSAIVATRLDSLKIMRSSMQGLADIALQAAGALPQEVRTASVALFAQGRDRVADIAKTSEYGGIKLLDGTFGASQDFAGKNKVYNTTVTHTSAAAAGRFTGVMTDDHAGKAITVNAMNNGDTITINGTVFTLKTAANKSIETEIQIGADVATTAQNIAAALNNSTADAVKQFRFTASGNAVTATRLATSNIAAAGIGVNANGGLALADAGIIAGASSGIDTTSLTKDDKLIGKMSAIALRNVYQGNAGNSAVTNNIRNNISRYGQAIGDAALADAPDANSAALYTSFTIGDTAYNGYIYQTNGGNASTMYCIRADLDVAGATVPNLQGKVFRISFGGIAVNTAEGVANFTTAFNTDAVTASFKQSRYMNISKDVSEILSGSLSVGSFEGMSIIMNSAAFDGVKVTDVKLVDQILEIDTIDDDGNKKIFKSNLPLGQLAAKGSAIVLTDAESGDTLTLVNGKKDLDLSTDEYQAAIASAMKKALGSSMDSTFVVGTDVSQTLTLTLGDMTWSTLVGNKVLQVSTQEAAQLATSIINNAIDIINAEIAMTASYDKTVDSLIEQDVVSSENLAAAIYDMDAVDLPDTKQEQDTALAKADGAIASIVADQKLQATLEKLLGI